MHYICIITGAGPASAGHHRGQEKMHLRNKLCIVNGWFAVGVNLLDY